MPTSSLVGAGVLFAYYLVFVVLVPTLFKAAGVPTEWAQAPGTGR